MTPIEAINQCLEEKKCFVLQGGAGSGKTETLKEVLEHISATYPDKKVACITHTNLAVDEIKSRVGDQYVISTIHSFLNSIIKDYKKNIFQCIFGLFKLANMERCDLEFYSNDEKEQKKQEHEKYKKIYNKFATKLFTVKGDIAPKVEGKKEYDQNPVEYNSLLNAKIDELNEYMSGQISTKDYNKIKYNETRFDSYKDLTFGHDGLLIIAHQLFSRYIKIGKILEDKFDFILIDEYQDTHEKIIEIFLELLPNRGKSIIGLFGDSMQAIYKDGIGSVKKYVDEGTLVEVQKEDNYRCSEQVISFINNLRNDGLIQKVALKHTESKIEERQGTVQFFYSVVDKKPNAFSHAEDKDAYLAQLNQLIEYAKQNQSNSKVLMLTNKSISKEVGFSNLYDLFALRYQDPKEYIDEVLAKLQFLDLIELCDAYREQNYNLILTELKKSRFPIRTIGDKTLLKERIENIIHSVKGAIETLNEAFANNLIRKAEKYDEYVSRKNVFLANLSFAEYMDFKDKFDGGNNTFPRMQKVLPEIEEEEFNELKKTYDKEKFYTGLFSEAILFDEIIKYVEYSKENLNYVTMHKTKGSSIDNVIVVLDEYFWNDYDFTKVFDPAINDDKKLASQKLVYVACSRTKSNLTCIKLITAEEEENVKAFFPQCQKIDF